MAGLLTSLVAQIGTQGDTSSHQGQTEQRLQRQPGEIEQRPHVGAVQFHKGVLQGERRGGKERVLESGPTLFTFIQEIFIEGWTDGSAG